MICSIHIACLCLHTCVLWDFSSDEFNQFCITWRQAVTKILNISYLTDNCLLHHIMGTLSIEQQIYKRFVKFFANNIMLDNKTIKICVQLILNGSGSVFSNNLSLICYTYRIIVYERL